MAEEPATQAKRRRSRSRDALPRRAEPWNVGSVLPWGIAVTVGDPLLLLVPFAAATLGILAVLGAGAPARVETLVPLWSLPPFDAYQDAGSAQLVATSPAGIWAFRAAALFFRAAVFGTLAHLALQRARDVRPDLGEAARWVRRRAGSLLVLELVSFALFGIPLVLAQGSLFGPGRPVSQLGALAGQLVLINAFLAAFDEPGPWAALRAGLRWTGRRPLGHLALALTATAASNGVFWIARAGEVARPRSITLTLYAMLHAVAAAGFLAAFARRYRLLYAPDGPQPIPRRLRRRRIRNAPQR